MLAHLKDAEGTENTHRQRAAVVLQKLQALKWQNGGFSPWHWHSREAASARVGRVRIHTPT
ncbi:unnamed protein product [Prunus armeniaca]